MQAEHLDVVADVADHARRGRACDIDDAADEARAADASREDDDVQATLLSSSREASLRARADPQLQPREVLHRVDVVGEVGHRDRDGLEAERLGTRAEAIGATRAVERRERVGRRQAERVRRPVEGLDEREAARGRRGEQRPEIVRHDARDVGVDDEDAARLDALEGRLHRRALAAARVGDRLGAGLPSRLRCLLVRCHDARAAHHDARGEHVAEHRVRERAAHPSRGVEPRLALRARKRDHDRDHASNYALSASGSGDTAA